jgi:hypothetical protein
MSRHAARLNDAEFLPALARYTEMMTEKEVCDDPRLGHLLSAAELRRARAAGAIEFLAGKRGVTLYHPDAIAEYLKRKERPCRNGSGNTGDTGFAESATLRSSTPAGTTPPEDAKLAEHLARKYSTKPRTGSSNSSAPPVPREAGHRTA